MAREMLDNIRRKRSDFVYQIKVDSNFLPLLMEGGEPALNRTQFEKLKEEPDDDERIDLLLVFLKSRPGEAILTFYRALCKAGYDRLADIMHPRWAEERKAAQAARKRKALASDTNGGNQSRGQNVSSRIQTFPPCIQETLDSMNLSKHPPTILETKRKMSPEPRDREKAYDVGKGYMTFITDFDMSSTETNMVTAHSYCKTNSTFSEVYDTGIPHALQANKKVFQDCTCVVMVIAGRGWNNGEGNAGIITPQGDRVHWTAIAKAMNHKEVKNIPKVIFFCVETAGRSVEYDGGPPPRSVEYDGGSPPRGFDDFAADMTDLKPGMQSAELDHFFVAFSTMKRRHKVEYDGHGGDDIPAYVLAGPSEVDMRQDRSSSKDHPSSSKGKSSSKTSPKYERGAATKKGESSTSSRRTTAAKLAPRTKEPRQSLFLDALTEMIYKHGRDFEFNTLFHAACSAVSAVRKGEVPEVLLSTLRKDLSLY